MADLGPVRRSVLSLVVIVLLFGASRLPKLGRSMGEGIRGFKEGLGGEEEKSVEAPVATQIEAKDEEKPTV